VYDMPSFFDNLFGCEYAGSALNLCYYGWMVWNGTVRFEDDKVQHDMILNSYFNYIVFDFFKNQHGATHNSTWSRHDMIWYKNTIWHKMIIQHDTIWVQHFAILTSIQGYIFPTLASMIYGIFAVSISTVASESYFSTANRV
jgi:hypothetical protein